MTLNDVIEFARKNEVAEDDIIDEIWAAETTTIDKVKMSLALFDFQPSYHVLTTLCFNYYHSSAASTELTNTILNKYLAELSNQIRDLSGMEYSLYFDIFEDPDRSEYAWNYFLSCKPNDHFIKIMLRNSGPVPYPLKQALYNRLIGSYTFHADIYRSIRHSCFDNCGKVDKPQALKTLSRLDLASEMKQIDSEVGFRRFEEVIQYLKEDGS